MNSMSGQKLKGIPYTGTLPAVLAGTKAGYLHRYKIYGNTEQASGTPTPENPIVPSGCGERTRNLCDGNNINQGYYAYADGQYGNITTWVNTYFIGIKSNTEYTAKFQTKYGKSRWYGFVWYDSDKQYISTTNTQSNPTGCELTATSPANAAFCVFNICSHNTTDGLSPYDIIYCMLNSGSTALPYEPYGYKLPLSSGNTSVDIYIGDDTLSTEEYVDSGTGKIYRMVGGVLTPVDPPVPFPLIPTTATSTTISWGGSGLAPSEFDSIQEWVNAQTYTRINGEWVADN